jgi:hypothetical protein
MGVGERGGCRPHGEVRRALEEMWTNGAGKGGKRLLRHERGIAGKLPSGGGEKKHGWADLLTYILSRESWYVDLDLDAPQPLGSYTIQRRFLLTS